MLSVGTSLQSLSSHDFQRCWLGMVEVLAWHTWVRYVEKAGLGFHPHVLAVRISTFSVNWASLAAPAIVKKNTLLSSGFLILLCQRLSRESQKGMQYDSLWLFGNGKSQFQFQHVRLQFPLVVLHLSCPLPLLIAEWHAAYQPQLLEARKTRGLQYHKVYVWKMKVSVYFKDVVMARVLYIYAIEKACLY